MRHEKKGGASSTSVREIQALVQAESNVSDGWRNSATVSRTCETSGVVRSHMTLVDSRAV